MQLLRHTPKDRAIVGVLKNTILDVLFLDIRIALERIGKETNTPKLILSRYVSLQLHICVKYVKTRLYEDAQMVSPSIYG